MPRHLRRSLLRVDTFLRVPQKRPFCSGQFQKSVSPVETPNDVAALHLAAHMCAAQTGLAMEEVGYAQRALEQMPSELMHLKSRALHMLDVAFGTHARVASSDSERGQLQHNALEALQVHSNPFTMTFSNITNC